MPKLFAALGTIILSMLVAIGGAEAQPATLAVGYGPTTDFASAFVAEQEGFFAKNGIAATLTMVPMGNGAIDGLASGSLDIADCTPPAFFQAVEGDIDLVGVAGGSMTSRAVNNFTQLVARTGTGIKTPGDLVGKRIATPGLNGTLFVLFKEWLRQKGVDANKVTFIEVPFPQMLDALRSGAVDAAIPIDPMLSRILAAGVAYRVANYMEAVPEDLSAVFYCSMRNWATGHPEIVKRFRAAIAEAVAFMGKNPDKTRADIAHYLRMPPAVMAKILISRPVADLTVNQLQWWYDTMKKQGAVSGQINDISTLILK